MYLLLLAVLQVVVSRAECEYLVGNNKYLNLKLSEIDINLIDSSKTDSIEVVTGNDTAKINWTTQYVEAKGYAIIDTSTYKLPSQAVLMARAGAIAVAQRNLLEIIQGVHIVSEVTVKNYITTSDSISKKVSGYIKGAELVGEPKKYDNIIEVTMRVPLYISNSGGATLATIFQQEAIKTTNTSTGIVGAENQNAPQNAQMNSLTPSLFPVVKNDRGEIIYNGAKNFDPKTGTYPKYVELGKEAWDALKSKNPEKIIEVAKDANGTYTPQNKKEKWEKTLKVAGTILKYGKFLIALI